MEAVARQPVVSGNPPFFLPLFGWWNKSPIWSQKFPLLENITLCARFKGRIQDYVFSEMGIAVAMRKIVFQTATILLPSRKSWVKFDPALASCYPTRLLTNRLDRPCSCQSRLNVPYGNPYICTALHGRSFIHLSWKQPSKWKFLFQCPRGSDRSNVQRDLVLVSLRRINGLEDNSYTETRLYPCRS